MIYIMIRYLVPTLDSYRKAERLLTPPFFYEPFIGKLFLKVELHFH